MDIRDKAHEASAFDRTRDIALLLCREAGAAARLNAPMWIQKLLKDFRVLVVDVFDIVLCEVILHHVRNAYERSELAVLTPRPPFTYCSI